MLTRQLQRARVVHRCLNLRVEAAGRERGVTLVELMVTMTISVVLAAAALGMFLATNKATGADIDANITSTSARGALDSWTALVQTSAAPGTTILQNSITNPGGGGLPVYSLTPTSLTIFSNLNNRSTVAGAAATARSAVSLSNLAWQASGTSNCPTSAAPGCLVETALNPLDASTVLSVRTLATRITPGATSAAGACGSTVAPPGDVNAGVSRLFTACAGGGVTLSAACALTPCTSTTEDPTVLSLINQKIAQATNTVPTAIAPTSIVIAFTATNSDSDGSTHAQTYVSAGALTGLYSATSGNGGS